MEKVDIYSFPLYGLLERSIKILNYRGVFLITEPNGKPVIEIDYVYIYLNTYDIINNDINGIYKAIEEFKKFYSHNEQDVEISTKLLNILKSERRKEIIEFL